MLPEINHNGKGKLEWQEAAANGSILPGGDAAKIETVEQKLKLTRYKNPLFNISYRVFRFFKNIRLSITERNKGIRLEAVLEGELPTRSDNGENIVLRTGQYQLSKHQKIETFFSKGTACNYFITHYSDDLLKSIGIKEIVSPSPVKQLTSEMSAVIQKLLHNPQEERIRDFYYSNCIRELLLLHMVNDKNVLYDGLSDRDLVAIYAADTLLQQNLHEHDDIPQIARKVTLNQTKLKSGFQQVFHMGVFERLTYHRMEAAKLLLNTTNRSITDIATEVGYSTRSGFITAFKRNFGIPPMHWKIQNRGS
ncbi:MAG: AraC family transcriptional regulator [Chitinophagaceae bacterium]